MGCTIDTWKADLFESRRLHVMGEGACSQGGCKLTLDYADPGINPDPEVVALQLVVACPEIGPPVMTPAKVRWEGRVEPAVKKVRIDTEAGTRWVEVNCAPVAAATDSD